MSEVKEVVVLGQLGSKDIQFVRAGKIARLKLSGGGKLPEELDGGWTDIKNAQSAIDSYFAKKKQEEEDKKKK